LSCGDLLISAELAEAIIIIVIGIIVIQGLWLSVLTFLMYNKKNKERQRAAELEAARMEAEKKTVIEDVFLLHRSGLLLKHYTRRLRPNVDSDVLSGMLVAVQEFVKDSFRGEKGVLNEIHFGELRIAITEGRWTIVACIVRGEKPIDIQPQIIAALADLEGRYNDLLVSWDGTFDALPEVDNIMRRLINGGYAGVVPRESFEAEVVLAS